MSARAEHQGMQQLDLFDLPLPSWENAPATPCAPVNPEDMTDGQLLEHFPRVSVGLVEAMGAEIRRRRPTGWHAAALKLWDRFLGFGQTRPMPEQQVVLSLAESIADRGFVNDLLARGPISECLEPDLLRAAAACRIALPTPIVERGMTARLADVRCAAVQLAIASNVPSETLLPYLNDPSRMVRREAAITLAEAGEAAAKASLLLEMRIQPSRAGLEALSFLADEDVVIAIGQIARQHPDWCPVVLDVLETMSHPKAERVAAGLMG